jgi:hypothetical protein
MGNLLNGNPEKGGGVIGVDHGNPGRKKGWRSAGFCPHRGRRIQGIGSGGQHDRHACGRFALKVVLIVITFATDFDLANPIQPDLRAVAVYLQQDLANCSANSSWFEPSCWRSPAVRPPKESAKIANRHLVVLGLDGGGDIGRG